MSAGALTPQTCDTPAYSVASADHFECCCTPFNSWSSGCAQVSTGSYDNCTKYCAANGNRPCADTCALDPAPPGLGLPDLAGARAWSLGQVSSCCRGSFCTPTPDQGYTCDHPWGDAPSTPARWSCCCL